MIIMDKLNIGCLFTLLWIVIFNVSIICGQHEDIPYQNVEQICKSCRCFIAQDTDKYYHYALNCANKSFEHILARWPENFGKDHTNSYLVTTFSYNNIPLLQQLPATNATVTFICNHCNIKQIQVPTFMDVPNIQRLDLSWNALKSDVLTPDIFRGPYRITSYEPIGLEELDLSHNQIDTLNKRLFEHTPNLTTLILSYNPLKVIDTPSMTALAAASSLKTLDLSYTGIKTFPVSVAKRLISLRQLDLSGNAMITVPPSLRYLGENLLTLNLADNAWQRLTPTSFSGLHALQRLNISHNNLITAIENGTFAALPHLERLDSAHNIQLIQFDLDSLRNSSNLTFLDISHCQLATLTLNMDLISMLQYNNTNTTATTTSSLLTTPISWPRLLSVKFDNNPWFCDCNFMLSLQYIKQNKTQFLQFDGEARCDTPYVLSGARIGNLTAIRICAMPMVREYHVIDEDPPRFLRKDYIILTSIIASIVIVLGLIIGFLVVCIRRRLKRDDFGTEPIRYTSVRSSNLSAFNVNGHSATNQVGSNL